MEIARELSEYIRQNEVLIKLAGRKLHLGIFSQPYLTLMINGVKTIESRFSKNKTAPYERISKDDIVFVKRSGRAVVGYLEIDSVAFFDLAKKPIQEIKGEYNAGICADEEFWRAKAQSRYATLIFIKELHLLSPFTVTKKDMRTWIVLN